MGVSLEQRAANSHTAWGHVCSCEPRLIGTQPCLPVGLLSTAVSGYHDGVQQLSLRPYVACKAQKASYRLQKVCRPDLTSHLLAPQELQACGAVFAGQAQGPERILLLAVAGRPGFGTDGRCRGRMRRTRGDWLVSCAPSRGPRRGEQGLPWGPHRPRSPCPGPFSFRGVGAPLHDHTDLRSHPRPVRPCGQVPGRRAALSPPGPGPAAAGPRPPALGRGSAKRPFLSLYIFYDGKCQRYKKQQK